MKTSRAILLILAGLAGGVGLRLAFSLPAETESTRPAGEVTSTAGPQTAPDKSNASSSRPSEADILAARRGARPRLLLKDFKEWAIGGRGHFINGPGNNKNDEQ